MSLVSWFPRDKCIETVFRRAGEEASVEDAQVFGRWKNVELEICQLGKMGIGDPCTPVTNSSVISLTNHINPFFSANPASQPHIHLNLWNKTTL
jgi:hypothetical protein